MPKLMQIDDIVLGRYEVVDLISDGAQAFVAKARDLQAGGPVAIRQLSVSPDQDHYPQELARFQRAARLRFNHRAVVDPITYGEDGGEWYTILPFIDGLNLDQHVAAHGGRLSSDEAVAITLVLAEGLDAIHAQGVIHRDIKPANIMIDRKDRPLILDLGICRILGDQTLTQGNCLLGTIPWIAPEQAYSSQAAVPASDCYSLAAVFYYMLTGIPLFPDSNPISVVQRICQEMPVEPRRLVRTVPRPVSRACMAMLAKRPEARPASAEELRAALDGHAPPLDGQASPAAAVAFCGSCGSSHPRDTGYCNRCGAEIGLAQVDAQCLACGAVVAEAGRCPGCGAAFVGDHRLRFTRGALAGRQFRIPQGEYVVGRAELCDRDQHISRRHLRVACLNGSVFLADAGSANKTYVNGQPADTATLLFQGAEVCIAGNTAVYTAF